MMIGSVKIGNNFFLAPLAGFTCNAFRKLCSDYGAGLTYAPIMHEKALLNNHEKVIDVVDSEKPIAGQLIGNNARELSKAAQLIEPYFDIIDLNLGCPRKKEVNCGIGAILLKKPEKIKQLLNRLVSSVNKPVTAKIRLGYDEVNVLEIARVIEDSGVKALTIHARTAVQDYSEPADWSWIKIVKDELSIPVIGNGDIFNPIDAKRMIDLTNCDAVMIGRAANGNPFIFSDLIQYFDNGLIPPKTLKHERLMAFKKFLEYHQSFNQEDSIHELRLHAYYFMKGLPHSKRLRSQLLKAKNKEELITLIKNH